MSYKKGKGGIQEGSTKDNGAGISTESQKDEDLHTTVVRKAVDEILDISHKKESVYPLVQKSNTWSVKKKEKLRYLTKKEYGWGKNTSGNSTVLYFDGYGVYYKKELVGITEHKKQGKDGNACERFCRYVAVAWNLGLEPWQIFGSFSGPGFDKPIPNGYDAGYSWKGGQTGGTIELLLDLGVTVITTPTFEELDDSVRKWVTRLVDKYES
jgi:hypothetical protein|tara:strand:+ start:551 stop:1183 length:633 start_codon:yes stop_codon:yes gene_type:complete